MTENLPDLPSISDADLQNSGLPSLMKMSPGLAIFFNDKLYVRCKAIARHMAAAGSMMPAHLAGKPEACFAVISNAINWNLNPYSVARATYQTPSGSIGYLGSLVQAILETSGRMEGGVAFDHYGDWSKVSGKFEVKTSPKGGSYPVRTWTHEDAKGLGVEVSAQMKGEVAPRKLKFDLCSAFPLNSPLWATDPGRQICYTSVRAFANLATPTLMYGIPFDIDPDGFDPMVDITPQNGTTPPRPTRDNAFERAPDAAAPAPSTTSPPTASATTSPPETTETPRDTQEEVNDVTQASTPPEAQEGTKDGGGESASDEPEPDGETPLARGKRLLDLVKTIRDVAELRHSIDEELGEDELASQLWHTACDARGREITGPGAGGKPKGRGK